MVKVVVFIRGGNVEDVQCNDTDAVIRIIDFDNKSDDGAVDHSEADWFWPNTQINEDFDKYTKDINEDFPNGTVSGDKGTFTSIWDDGTVIETALIEYDEKTGRVQADISDYDPNGSLVREFITLPNGDDIDVCTKCHTYTLRSVMVEDETGKGLHEEQVCPECEADKIYKAINR